MTTKKMKWLQLKLHLFQYFFFWWSRDCRRHNDKGRTSN